MFREMRRKKQLLAEEETRRIAENASHTVIGVIGDEGYPYTFVVNTVLEGNKLYFHSAKAGHKIDAIKNEPRCSFSIVDADEVVGEEFTTYFRSVQGFGRAHIAEDEEERAKGFRLLSEKYSLPYMDKFDEQMKSAPRADVIVIDIEHMTGKEAIELINK